MAFNLVGLIQQVMAQQQQPAQEAQQLGGLQGSTDQGPWSQPQGQYRASEAAPAPAAAPTSNYEWSPDHSSYIDRSQFPGAQWMDADPGGGSEGAPGRPAGWYTPGGYNSSSTEGGYTQPQLVDDGRRTYWDLKNAGLWNLKDPNSDTWKYLQAQGGGGDVKTDPNALYRALANGAGLGQAAMGRNEAGQAQVENAYREALDGLNPQFVDAMAKAAGENTMGYWTASKQHEGQGFMKDISDTGVTLRDLFMQTPLGVALIAFTGGLAAGGMGAGAGAAEGGAAVGAGAGAGEALGAGAAGAFDMGGSAGLEGLFGIGTSADVAAVEASLGGGAALDSASAGGTAAEAADAGAGIDASSAGANFAGEPIGLNGGPTGLPLPGVEAGAAIGEGIADASSGGANFPAEPIGLNGGPTGMPLPGAAGAGAALGEGIDASSGGANFAGEPVGLNGGPTGMPLPTQPGIIDSMLQFGKDNPFVTAGLLNLGGGIIAGIGNNITANQVTDKKVQAEKELELQKLENAKALEEWKRAFIQGGSYFDAKLPFQAPQQPRQLRRPNGTVVQRGIVSSAMPQGS